MKNKTWSILAVRVSPETKNRAIELAKEEKRSLPKFFEVLIDRLWNEKSKVVKEEQ